jgi:SpoVK/Ycf46/Vps4 family AAA+-type ATPase
MIPDSLLDSLRAAVDASPDDVSLRLHLAELLAQAGRRDEAVYHAANVLRRDPRHAGALRLLARAAAAAEAQPSFAEQDDPDEALAWLDRQLADIEPAPVQQQEPAEASAFLVESVTERLSDVAGQEEVKQRLEATVLMPLRNPELGGYYGRTGRGGLLLYGPPGCGKTFLARALAGELGAGFLSVSLADVLDMFVGQSERNLAELFNVARRHAPCVVFFDEADAIGQKRSQLQHTGRRGVVNQLLAEMDGVASANAGVFVLGATNHPWDVDVALRRPGRFDRTQLVLPPDELARSAIFALHLRKLPTEQLDLEPLARATEGYSGADIAYACDLAAEAAMLDSARTGKPRPVSGEDLAAAVRQVRPSIGAWLDTARTVVQFANQDGSYDELAAYLTDRKRR